MKENFFAPTVLPSTYPLSPIIYLLYNQTQVNFVKCYLIQLLYFSHKINSYLKNKMQLYLREKAFCKRLYNGRL